MENELNSSDNTGNDESEKLFSESAKHFRKLRKMEIFVPDEDTWIALCDISKKASKNAYIAVQIRKSKKPPYKIQTFKRKAVSAPHAELIAISIALEEVMKKAGEHKQVLVLNDNLTAIRLCSGEWNPRRAHIKQIVHKINRLTKDFDEVIFQKCDEKTARPVDRAATRARKNDEQKIQIKVEKRIKELELSFTKAKKIKIVEKNGNYYAKSSTDNKTEYKVTIEPESCTCPQWLEKWKNIHGVGRHKYRISCKHICALAIFLKKEKDLKSQTIERLKN